MAETEKQKIEKLVAMERDLKERCDQYDQDMANLDERTKELEKREKAFDKKFKSLSNSEAFGEMVTLVDRIYTLYTADRISDKGLYESIKLLLDARSRYNSEQ